MVKLFIYRFINMAIGRSQLPKEMDGKLRGAKPSRAMLKYKRKKK